MERYILVPYKINGQSGKILVRENANTGQMKKACILDYIEQNKNKFEVLIKFD